MKIDLLRCLLGVVLFYALMMGLMLMIPDYNSMTFGSLFSGIGGIDLGLERAGMECRWQVEIDPFCCKVLEKHWPNVKRYGDITKIDGRELECVDVLAGGFPCQDLSQAGKRVGIEGSRSGLWFEFARLIGELRPQFVLIENVPGILVPGAMSRVVGELARLGYVGCWRCLRASEFGASHLRKRVFIVAYSNEWHRAELAWTDQRAVARCDGTGNGASELGDSARELHDGAGNSGAGRRREYPDASGALGNACRELASARRVDAGAVGCETGEAGSAIRGAYTHSGGEVADSSNGFIPISGRGQERRDGPRSAGEILPDSRGTGLPDPQQEEFQRTGRRIEGGATPELRGAFAPGPDDSRWPDILRDCPSFAPALESPIRGVANGLPDWMERTMQDRTKRLGRLGNSVVPQVAEWAGRRMMEFYSLIPK